MDYVIESGLSSELRKLQHENATLVITTYYYLLHKKNDIFYVYLWLLWQLSYHGNKVCADLMPFIPRKLHAEYQLNSTLNKGVIDISLWLPWQLSYHSNEVCVYAFHPKDAPYQM